MLELSSIKKNKIHLADYNFQQDIESRIILSDFSAFDYEVLEEILFSPLKISAKKLVRSLGCSEADLDAILQRLSQAGLIQVSGDSILVDKDRRKYFEVQICRFSDQFKPDMEFLQGLLKLIPIHILPSWYAIPRSSNNIFESIIEKYLLTPQIYQRYLSELNFSDPVLHSILEDVLNSPELRVSTSDLISKYNLARRDFEQLMLQLEFHFGCFVTYSKEEDHWIESVTPLHEWREYQMFLRQTAPSPIGNAASIERCHQSDFAFIEDLGSILTAAKKKPIPLEQWTGTGPLPLLWLPPSPPFANFLRKAKNMRRGFSKNSL